MKEFYLILWNVLTRSRYWLIFCAKLIKSTFYQSFPFKSTLTLLFKVVIQVSRQGVLCGRLFPKPARLRLEQMMRVSLNAIFTPSQIFQNYFSWSRFLWARIEDGLMSESRDTSSVQFWIFVIQKQNVVSKRKLSYSVIKLVFYKTGCCTWSQNKQTKYTDSTPLHSIMSMAQNISKVSWWISHR
jgi:hypothetical protein